jgi:hypothetical protein
MPVTRTAALAAISTFLAGCAAVTTADGARLAFGSDDFRAYVERVFREQNRVADALAFALEGARPAGEVDLAAAEDELIAACAGLNELAASRRDEQRLGVRRSAAAARRAPDCERATLAAQAALAEVAARGD